MKDFSAKLLVGGVSKTGDVVKGERNKNKMENIRKYWNDYLGDCNALHKYLKQKEKRSSSKHFWSSLRLVEVFFRSLGQVSNSLLKCDK